MMRKLALAASAFIVLPGTLCATPPSAAPASEDRDLTMCEAIKIETQAITRHLESHMGALAQTMSTEATRAIAENGRMQAMSAVSSVASMAGPIGPVLDFINHTIHDIEGKRQALVMAREKAAATMTVEQSASRLVQLSYDAMDHGCPEAAVQD